MKYAIIDIGSNSVRLMISIDGKTENKFVKTTRLAEKMGEDCLLQAEPIERTAQAVSFFADMAKQNNCDKLYIFATAAVRQAKNKQTFLDLTKTRYGLSIDVIDGQLEAKLGAMGAINGQDGGIIDVGGASSEVVVLEKRKTIFSKSLDIGCVKLFDKCGQDKEKILKVIDEKIMEYGIIPKTNFFGIGGTATSLASISQKMKIYDPKKVHGYKLSIEKVKEIRDMLFFLSLEEKYSLDGLQKERAQVISGGVGLIYAILKKANADCITISESDNLEGYLMTKMEKI